MARRGENIYKRKDGRWEGRVPIGYSANGKRKYLSLYAKSYSELKYKLKNHEETVIIKKNNTNICMKEIFKIWIEDNQYTWKKSTLACYNHLVQHQILPYIGTIPISEFNNTALNCYITLKKQDTENSLSDTYLKSITNLIIQAMRYVKKEYDYDINVPIVSTKRETVTERTLPDQHTLNELKKYLLINANDCTCLGILLCWHTGIRIGELCALCWKDIDLDNGMLQIKKTMQRVRTYEETKTTSKVLITVPKTRKSIRSIPIPKTVLELLVLYKSNPESYLVKGVKLPYAEPRTVQYRFQNILYKCNLPSFNFHMLRHAFATSCIRSGFDVNSLSEILGHSSIQITLNLYVHTSYEQKKLLMDNFNL